jgi:two-component system, OmpR family, sensor histidine kinase MtrB
VTPCWWWRRNAPREPPVFYLFFDSAVVDQALGNLWRFLAVGAGVVIAISVITAGAVARGVLRPVRTAGAAAQQLAAGDLATRVSVESDDEFGRMSEAFNTMAATLEAQIVALEEAEARERRFVADVSHELRTPLTGLSNEAHLLAAGLHTIEGPTRRAAELLIDDVGRLRRLVDELLEISRLESGDGAVELTETDLARFLQAMVAARLPTARLLVPDSNPVLCDRRGLERIVGNLLDNAAAHAPEATVEVAASVTDGVLRLTVTDDGPGVGEGSLERLFDRFFKADAARQGGSGLGLAIARQHARRLGGDITVTRHPAGSGLSFEVTVPVTVLLPDGDDDETRRSHDEGVTDEIERRMS